MRRRSGHAFIDGGWRDITGNRISVVNPATEAVIGEAPDSAAETVQQAVAAARRALGTGEWPTWDLQRRIAVCGQVVDRITERIDEFALLQTEQMGVPISASRAMLASGGNLFRAYADGARATEFSYLRRDAVGCSLIRRAPVGVVGAIVPWNGPLPAAMNKIIPALLAGCTLVLKPAPQTPWDAGLVAELFAEAGVPRGVLSVVPGGRDTGRALVEVPGVDKITFTGSTASGRIVGEACGRMLRHQSLELGGKSPGILLDDADLGQAIPQIVSGNFFNSGQICVAITRVLVPRSMQADLVDGVRAAAAALVVGDPADDRTQVGPLVTGAARDRVEDLIESGRAAGADLLLGGRRHEGRGWFITPTVFANVTSGMRIAREEIFGPVLSVLPYDDEEHALAIANDSDYGLHGAVFSADSERALAVAQRIESGSVAINVAGLTPGTPYGGVKCSGVGREHGREGLAAYLDYRAAVLPADQAARLQQDGLPVR
jgi:aldehyde dehydrogenase (NAD+)